MTANISVKTKKNITTAKIIGEFDIYFINDLKARLTDTLNSSEQLIIDLSEVDSIDTTGIQVLTMLKNEANYLNKPISFIEHSQSVVEAIELFNLAAQFGDPLVLTGKH